MASSQPIAQVLLDALAGDPAPLRRVLGDLAGRRGHPDHLGAGLHQRAVPLLAAADRLRRVGPVGDVHRDQRHAGDVPVRVVRGEPGERPLPVLVRVRRRRAARRLRAAAARRGRVRLADRLVRLVQRLAVGQHVAHGRLDPGGERARPHLGGQQAQVRFQVEAVEPGQGLVDPADAEIGPEEGEADGGLAQQGGEQGRVRHVQPGDPWLGHGSVSAHRRTPVPLRSSPAAWAMQRLLPAHCGHKQASGDAAASERKARRHAQWVRPRSVTEHPQWPRRRASHILGDIVPRRGHHGDLVVPERSDGGPPVTAGYPVTWLRLPELH